MLTFQFSAIDRFQSFDLIVLLVFVIHGVRNEINLLEPSYVTCLIDYFEWIARKHVTTMTTAVSSAVLSTNAISGGSSDGNFSSLMIPVRLDHFCIVLSQTRYRIDKDRPQNTL